MGSLKKAGNKKKVTNVAMSRVKNQELVLKMQLHIAKKASKLFIKKGYHKTSIRDLSEATGMAVGSLYNYIQKKKTCSASFLMSSIGRFMNILKSRVSIVSKTPGSS